MKKTNPRRVLGVPRTLGLILALVIFVVSLIVFNIIPFIGQTRQLATLRESAQSYDKIFSFLQDEQRKYQNYHETLLPFHGDLNELVQHMRNRGYYFPEVSAGRYSFSGQMSSADFSWLMESLAHMRGIRVEELDIRNSFPFPVIVGQPIQPHMEFRTLVIVQQKANESLLRR